MSELTDALRQLADKLDKHPLKPTMAVVVVCDDLGKCNATYIGKMLPHRDAGIKLCTMGIERFLEGMTPSGQPVSTTRGSTH